MERLILNDIFILIPTFGLMLHNNIFLSEKKIYWWNGHKIYPWWLHKSFHNTCQLCKLAFSYLALRLQIFNNPFQDWHKYQPTIKITTDSNLVPISLLLITFFDHNYYPSLIINVIKKLNSYHWDRDYIISKINPLLHCMSSNSSPQGTLIASAYFIDTKCYNNILWKSFTGWVKVNYDVFLEKINGLAGVGELCGIMRENSWWLSPLCWDNIVTWRFSFGRFGLVLTLEIAWDHRFGYH